MIISFLVSIVAWATTNQSTWLFIFFSLSLSDHSLSHKTLAHFAQPRYRFYLTRCCCRLLSFLPAPARPYCYVLKVKQMLMSWLSLCDITYVFVSFRNSFTYFSNQYSYNCKLCVNEVGNIFLCYSVLSYLVSIGQLCLLTRESVIYPTDDPKFQRKKDL